MTTNKLSLTERAEVARVVTGCECKITDHHGIFVYTKIQKPGYYWDTKKSRQWKMLVEWLADRIKAIDTTEDRLVFSALTFIEAITERDAAKLEKCVHEFHTLKATT